MRCEKESVLFYPVTKSSRTNLVPSLGKAGLLFLALVLPAAAVAHMPSMTENNSSQDSAILIEDNDWSQVFYHEAGCDARELWLEIDGTAGEPLFIQLGAPVFSTLEDHTWQFALVGPGLPETPTPFPLSGGLGAELRTGAEAGDAEFFYEPFTQTNSWILHEETFVLPETGTYYVVAWELSGFPSRFWVSTGTTESLILRR